MTRSENIGELEIGLAAAMRDADFLVMRVLDFGV